MKIIVLFLIATMSSFAFGAETVQCYEGIYNSESQLTAELTVQEFSDISECLSPVSYLKIKFRENGKNYSAFGIGDEDAIGIMQAGGEVIFGVEDDCGRAILRQNPHDSSLLQISGEKGNIMSLILDGCDRYSDDFDMNECEKKLSTDLLELKLVSCLKK